VSARRGFGDETWRLAEAGDAEALRRAAELLLAEPLGLAYEGHRARAFALAVEGQGAAALDVLNEGWTDDWPFPTAYALDVARVHYLARDHDRALDALSLAVRSVERTDGSGADLAAACVRRRPSLCVKALRSVLGGGTAGQRVAAAAVVVRAVGQATRHTPR
jgi:hypothetical protein